MGKYIELTEENFESVTSKGVSMVDFWAPWCGPCRMLAPVIDSIAEEFDGKANICKVNTDEQEALSAKFGIRSVPTIIYYKDGQEVDKTTGAVAAQAIKDKINALL